ncbi:N-acetylglucosamine kinase [Aquimarina intermedia]|uniref:N-acetylglucosamine kinase-like BadF-type ATPase n=1 Tax=Aquimarina intermedia TaxID=350814 RepID=A0A5S5CBW2_9FLAO|nr:N-acetylglucosamine kinase [Aquimarina intermedia]TYP75840.1 hypothetical protein BD809_10247 [Aquimarina intermedia]
MLSIFTNSISITVQEDIIAAVHAVTDSPGVVCILGTGANSCFFNGVEVFQKVPALGYVLADEGSGNYFGKKVLKDYYFKKMPLPIAYSFEQLCSPILDTILSNIHNSTNPSKYLASYARFLFEHRGNAYIENLLEQGVEEFVALYIMPYKKELEHHPIHFVGSIAFNLQDIIKEQLSDLGYNVQRFLKSPITKLTNQIITKGI